MSNKDLFVNNLFIYPNKKDTNILAFTTKKYGYCNNKLVENFDFNIFFENSTYNILKNIELLKEYHRINKLMLLKQVHGNKVLSINQNNYPDVFLSEADGLYTTEKNIAFGIFTADCFPVLLWGKKSISALHCGWRSINSSIIEESIKLFEQNNDFPEYVYVGPGICNKCYEISQDMVDKLNKKYKPEIFIEERDGKLFLNLRKLLEYVLLINNIDKYEFSDFSSCCSDDLYSYRIENGMTGRMLSVIMRR